jgi:glyoxalase family protein
VVADIPSTGVSEPDTRTPWTHPEIPVAVGRHGFHGVTLGVTLADATLALLTGTMGYRIVSTEGGRTRLTTRNGGPGTYVDVLVDPALPRGLQGAGTVHHVAFRTPNGTTQANDLAAVRERGMHVSPVMDRSYFHSIYYREPAGILFEIATDTPGFATDETVEQLGTTLRLPPQYEAQRAAIEAALPKLS